MVRAPAGDWDYERHGHGYTVHRLPARRKALQALRR